MLRSIPSAIAKVDPVPTQCKDRFGVSDSQPTSRQEQADCSSLQRFLGLRKPCALTIRGLAHNYATPLPACLFAGNPWTRERKAQLVWPFASSPPKVEKNLE